MTKDMLFCNAYIGGIRPNKEDPSSCSFTNNVAILMAFFTPTLEMIIWEF